MTALAANRKTDFRAGDSFEYPVAANKEIFAGALVVLDASGNAEPATTATGKVAVGIAQAYVKSGSTAAAYTVHVKSGVCKLANGESITKTSIGDMAYALDDQTVYKTGTGKSPVGIIVDVESDGVWVMVKPPFALDATGFAVANNLSEGTAATMRSNLGLDTMAVQAASAVAITGGAIAGITDLAVADGGTGASTAAAARTNLGLANKHVVHTSVPIGSLAGAGAFRALAVAPIAGTISKIYSVLTGHALATGDATLTGKINGTGITTGVITITQSGSAIGDKDVCSPSALNVVAAGDVIEMLVGGTNDNSACGAEIYFEITEG